MATVLLVAHHYPPHVGGLEVVAERQAQSMVERGHRLIVLTSRIGSMPHVEEPQSGLKVVRVACSHLLEKLFFIPFPLFSPGIISVAWKQLRNADVVHIHDVFYLSSWVAAVLSKIAAKPVVLTQHVALVEHPSWFVMWIQRLVYATVGRWIFGRARHIIVYNENVRTFLLGRGVPEKRIACLSNGINVEMFRPCSAGERSDIRDRYGLPLGRPLVLFVGRLVQKKGFEILLNAADPHFDLVFIGPGEASSDGCKHGVHWLGALDQAKAAEVYRACDVFACPSMGEIFTLVMQEAMASGLPVITTDEPAYIDSVVEDVVVLCPRRSDCFRQAILALLANPDRMRALSEGGRKLALSHFDWNANVERLIAIYSDICVSRPSAST